MQDNVSGDFDRASCSGHDLMIELLSVFSIGVEFLILFLMVAIPAV